MARSGVGKNALQIAPVVVLGVSLADKTFEVVGSNETLPKGDLLGRGDLQPLSLLDGGDVAGSLQQAVRRSRIELRKSPAHFLNGEFSTLQI